ncbi:MAG: fused MFS/spermidine synthase [Planctomycetota bacterium]
MASGRRRAPYAILFMISGMAGLVYEVTYFRWLGLVLGQATLAAGVVLGAFLLGLALGGAAAGRFADRVERPLCLYGVLELALAVAALVTPFAFKLIDAVYLALPEVGRGVRGVLAFTAVMGPTFLMGATYPAMNRCLIAGPADGPRGASRVYGLQTLGAALGAFVTGFFLLERCGLWGALAVGVGLSTASGAMALLVGWRLGRARPAVTARRPEGVGRRHAAAFLLGAAALALQVLDTRLLAFHLPTHTYSFAAALSVQLVALSLGAWLARLLVTAVRGSSAALFVIALSGAAVTLVSLPLLAWVPEVVATFRSVGGGVEGVSFLAGVLLASGLLLLPPALFLGAFLPAAVAAGAMAGERPGRASGRLWAANCLGSAVGALIAGGPLIPNLGLRGGVVAAGSAAVLAAAVLIPPRRFLLGGLLVAALVAAIPFLPTERPLLLDTPVLRGERAAARRLLAYREGAVLTASVVEEQTSGERLLYTDAFQAAATGVTYRYMKILGHLPLLASRQRERALCIAFGTGTTAGSMARHEALQQLDLAEISSEVVGLASYFETMNGGLPKSPRSDLRVRMLIEDGRDVLRRRSDPYDAITLEPFLPHMPSAVPFYTVEFYRMASAKLSAGGAFCGWLPLGSEDPEAFAVLLASFAAVFPDAFLFKVEESLILLGFRERGVPLDVSRLEQRLAEPGVRADLATVGLDSPEALLATFVAGAEDVLRVIGKLRPMTDEWPLVEFQRPRASVEGFRNLARNLDLLLRAGANARPPRLAVSDGGEAEFLDRLARLRTSRRLVLQGERAAAAETFARLTGRSVEGVSVSPGESSAALFERALEINPDEESAARRLGRRLLSAEEIVALLEQGAGLEMLSRLAAVGSPRARAVRAELLERLALRPGSGWMARALGMFRADDEIRDRLRSSLLQAATVEETAAHLVALVRGGDREGLRLGLGNEGVRLQAALEAAGELEEPCLLSLLEPLLDHPELAVRLQVVVVINRIAGQTFGYDPYAPATAARARSALEEWLAPYR